MKLYVTFTSPFARMARVVVLEKDLADRVEIVEAKTRTAGSAYYDICPSGRVPFLWRDGEPGLEDSAVICWYLDNLDESPALHDDSLEHRRLEGLARAFIDNVAVWGRELYRPVDERSPGVIAHEQARCQRLADQWEREIAHPLMQGPLNMAQIALLCGLEQDRRNAAIDWRSGHPALTAWHGSLADRQSFAATRPPRQNLGG